MPGCLPWQGTADVHSAMAPRSPLACVALLCLATGLAVLAAAPMACAQWHALATHRSPALASRLRRVGLTPAPSGVPFPRGVGGTQVVGENQTAAVDHWWTQPQRAEGLF